jgi:Xaa-Pro aminopeptidase
VFRANYWAEIARTFVVGAPTPEQTRLLDLVQQAQRAARKRLSVSHNVKNHALTPRASLVGREER